MFSWAPPLETLRFSGNKINFFPRELSLMICYIAGNSLNLAVTAVVGQHSRVTVHCYSLTSKMLQCWRENVSQLDDVTSK